MIYLYAVVASTCFFLFFIMVIVCMRRMRRHHLRHDDHCDPCDERTVIVYDNNNAVNGVGVAPKPQTYPVMYQEKTEYAASPPQYQDAVASTPVTTPPVYESIGSPNAVAYGTQSKPPPYNPAFNN